MRKNEQLRKQLIYLKWAKNIKYKEMSKKTGVCESTIYNFIAGRRNGGLNNKTIEKLLNYIKENTENEE